MAKKTATGDACSTRTELADRPLLTFVEAVKVMALFKVLALAHPRLQTLPAFES